MDTNPFLFSVEEWQHSMPKSLLSSGPFLRVSVCRQHHGSWYSVMEITDVRYEVLMLVDMKVMISDVTHV
jgi:hypothetical protein